MVPALFLDRDGVINENNENYVRCLDDIKFIPGSIDALVKIKSTPYKIIIVTNQSAVGRGIISRVLADNINEEICRVIKDAGGRVDQVLMCPHAPSDRCECRKPKPGLLFQAATDLSIDLSQSIIIGDALTDVQAGQSAGLRETILVLSGRGKEQLKMAQKVHLKPFIVYETLYTATMHLFSTYFAFKKYSNSD